MSNDINTKPSGFLVFLFAFFPGIAQLYMGLTCKGLSMLGTFVALIVTAVIISIGPIIAVLIVPMMMLYFYSFFDAFKTRRNIMAGNMVEDTDFLTGIYKSVFSGSTEKNMVILRIGGIILLITGAMGMLYALGNLLSLHDEIRYFVYNVTTFILPVGLVILGVLLIGKGVRKK